MQVKQAVFGLAMLVVLGGGGAVLTASLVGLAPQPKAPVQEGGLRIGTQSVRASGSVMTAKGAGLTMPALQACKPPPTGDLLEEGGVAQSEGLSYEAVSSSMNAFIGNVMPCASGSAAVPTGTLQLELTVACTGRVESVAVVESADFPAEMAACIRDVLRYTPFPAHDLPDGETFLYPLRFTH